MQSGLSRVELTQLYSTDKASLEQHLRICARAEFEFPTSFGECFKSTDTGQVPETF